MELLLLLCAGVILLCMVANRFSNRFGMPALLLFMALGMLFGSDGLLRISFDNYKVTERICAVALTFIMFYGGFCTKWKMARPVAGKAIALSSLGTIVTAVFTGAFCHFVLHMAWTEGFLVGAVISSTDAASVFSILRSKNLDLKNGTSSMLELESGSNDPTAYMLTMLAIMLIEGESMKTLGYMVFSQVVFGALIGLAVAVIGVLAFQKFSQFTDGVENIFVIALVLLAYALPTLVNGNGYLSVYLMGIVLGNSKIRDKIVLVHFFDGINGLAQIVIFFLLGLLSFPHKIPQIFLPTLLIALFLTFVARPVAVFVLLLPAKCSIRQCLVVSMAGLRGAASIVFAIMVIADGVYVEYDLFHTVFLISLLSVAFQGSLLPWVAKKLDMVEPESDVRKTFNDYQEDSSLSLMRLFIPKGHNWENRTISEVSLPTDSLALMIKRGDETLIPRGDTKILANDSVILSVPVYRDDSSEELEEIRLDKHHGWCGHCIEELALPDHILIAMIKRGDENIIPRGKTVLKENDVVVLYH